jgi:hypothetical protein
VWTYLTFAVGPPAKLQARIESFWPTFLSLTVIFSGLCGSAVRSCADCATRAVPL